jgi:type 1 glutamine amidotransferase
MPVVWKKAYGKGRVFYNSVAHALSHITDEPSEEGMEIIKRGIQWASASKYEPMEEWMSVIY